MNCHQPTVLLQAKNKIKLWLHYGTSCHEVMSATGQNYKVTTVRMNTFVKGESISILIIIF